MVNAAVADIQLAHANTITTPVVVNTSTTTSPVTVTAGSLTTSTISGETSTSTLSADVKVNGQSLAQGGSALNTDYLDIFVDIFFDELDIASSVQIYAVAQYNGEFFMKDNGGNWVPWSGVVDELITYRTTVAGSKYTVEVVTALHNLAGSFNVYVGYKNAAGDLIYNIEPVSFEVK